MRLLRSTTLRQSVTYGECLLRRYICQIVDLLLLCRDVPLRDFQAKFGTDSGNWLYNVLRGVEYAEVAAKTDVKSMLSSKNFKPSLRAWDEVVRVVSTNQ